MRGALLAFLSVMACGGDRTATTADGAGDSGDGFQRIDVTLGDGTSQPMWIYAASPAGAGPFPVVVYGHGQGATNALPECSATSSSPTHVDVAPSVEVADSLASVGYVGIAVFYRGFGEPPSPGTVVVRDHHVLDSRSMLAAAQWARDRHGKGSARVAFMGNSMGSFPAAWSVAPHPALADLQAGLDIRGAVASGMLGNHIANSSPQFRVLDDPNAPASTRVAGIALFTFLLASLRAAEAGHPQLELGTIAAHTSDLTAAGRDLVVAAFLAPPPAVAECSGVTAVYCSSVCAGRVIGDLFTSRAGGQIRTDDWFTADTIAAFSFWEPPASIDPGATSNTLLAHLRDLSPAYALPGPLVGPTFLPLVSMADHTLPPQTGGSMAPAQLYLDHLQAVGASLPDHIPVVTAAGCDHGDYYLPGRPACGWSLVEEWLATALR